MLPRAYSILQGKSARISHPFTRVFLEQDAGILVGEDEGSGGGAN